MPVITALSVQKKRTDWCSIYIDGKYEFSLPLSAVAENRLAVGKQLNGSEVDGLKRQSGWNKLYEGALKKLARRAHSRQEIIDYLKKRQASDEDVQTILAKLDSFGYLNDVAFAEAWVRERRRLKNRSTRQLRAELFKKGVERSIIDEVLQADHADQKTALVNMIAKKSKLSRYQDQKKLIAYLQRQGFSYHEIKSALTESED